MTSASAVNDLDELTTAGATVYRYTADGSVASATDGTGTASYRCDASGRLVGVTSPASGTYQYLHDALGDRIATIRGGVRTDELFDPTGDGSLVGQFSGTAAVDHYVYGLGLAAQVDASGAANACGFDALGDTAELTGPAGAVLDRYYYLPSGLLANSSGTASNPFTFVGASGVISDGSGLSWMRNRQYDPAGGTFTQPDPSGLAGGLNAYEYANDAPTRYIDPDGLEPGTAIGNAASITAMMD